MAAIFRRGAQILGIVLSILVCKAAGNGVTTCWVQSVDEGESTNITCNFPVDVRLTNQNIKIQRQPLQTDKIDPDEITDVLSCYWRSKENLECEPRTADGYQLVGDVKKQAVLRIVTATPHHVGKYSCQTMPSDSQDIRPCFFILKGTSDVAAVYNRVKDLPDELLEMRENLGASVQQLAAVVAATLALCVVAIVATVLLFIFHERVTKFLNDCRSSRQKSGGPEIMDEESPKEKTNTGPNDKTEQLPTVSKANDNNEPKETEPLLTTEDTTGSAVAKPENPGDKKTPLKPFWSKREDKNKNASPKPDKASGHNESTKAPAQTPAAQAAPGAAHAGAVGQAQGSQETSSSSQGISQTGDTIMTQAPQQSTEHQGKTSPESSGETSKAKGEDTTKSRKSCSVM